VEEHRGLAARNYDVEATFELKKMMYHHLPLKNFMLDSDCTEKNLYFPLNVHIKAITFRIPNHRRPGEQEYCRLFLPIAVV